MTEPQRVIVKNQKNSFQSCMSCLGWIVGAIFILTLIILFSGMSWNGDEDSQPQGEETEASSE